MTSRPVFLACLAALLAASALTAQQTGTVSGTVRAARDGAPLAGASVVIVGTARSVFTNALGQYHLSVPAGTGTIRARLIGYESAEQRVMVKSGETATADFRLAATPLALNEVVVIGARTSRTATETPVPVDVVTTQELTESGRTEVNQMLATLAPSFNASHQAIADGSDHVNPASLRGLGPDQVLVLVNGKRRYSSALVHVNGTFGRGTVGVDLNAIPAAAIERIEVLRDGASAQYGSDAIAGVINIVLKRQTEHLDVSNTVGSTPGGGGFWDMADHHDGDQLGTDANYGFAVGDRGFFNVTASYLNRGATSRAAPYSGNDIFPGVTTQAGTDSALRANNLTRQDFTMRVGQSAATEGMAFYNTVVPLSETAEFYSFGGVGHRDGLSAGFFRLPSQQARVVPQLYPFGFLPDIHTIIDDHSAAAGVRGSVDAWDVDFSLTAGGNAFHFFVDNSDNASMGAASPTTFDAGRLSFAQTVGNLDVVRPLGAWGGLRSLSFVAGAEFRREEYRIEAGEEASWQLGNGGSRPGIDFDTTSSGAPKEPGAQVFPGFQPSNQVDRTRNSLSVYGGFESQVSERLLLDLGGRLEDYSDFGRTINGKVATRFQVVPALGLRAAASTGFRAPSLGQAWFNNVSNQFVIDASGNLVPNRILTSNNESRVTQTFGVPPLKEESSVNVSFGVVAQPASNWSVTADAYRITIADRIVLSSQFQSSDPAVGAVVRRLLAPFARLGVTTAQFFTNAVDTRTTGLDIVVTHSRTLAGGTLSLTGSANFTKTEVEQVNVPQAMADTFTAGNLPAVRGILLNREDRNRLEDALPREKGGLAARWARGRFAGLARATYYGTIFYRHPNGPANDERFGAKTLFDLDLSYEVRGGVRLAIGGSNIFNTYPDQQVHPTNSSLGRFIYSRRVTQFGMNGGFYYTRVRVSL
ncbi:MAG: TonB-dependent receptor [Gemmatimonadetes bacterium]|nr:MAG: TonB-dependent receptor [Gemmatimonadota bacterium]